jgi:hypothetical protein
LVTHSVQLHDIITKRSSVNLPQNAILQICVMVWLRPWVLWDIAVHYWVVGSDVLKGHGAFTDMWLEVIRHLARFQCYNSVSVWQTLLTPSHFIIQAPLTNDGENLFLHFFVGHFQNSVRSADKRKDLLTNSHNAHILSFAYCLCVVLQS